MWRAQQEVLQRRKKGTWQKVGPSSSYPGLAEEQPGFRWWRTCPCA